MTIGKCHEAVVFIFVGQAILLSNVAASQNDATVDNLAYAVPNQMEADGVVYNEFTSEGGAVRTTPVPISADDGQYSKLQRDSSPVAQSTITTGSDDVEAYYGKLGSDEQYTVSAV